jgi:WD40 repeat protein
VARNRSQERHGEIRAAQVVGGPAGIDQQAAPAQPERPDVFVSYSRRDKEFVERRLLPALLERDKDVWVDLEDIPPAADWRQKIWAGIEAAKSFVFVLSPDSASSEVCSAELAHAVELNKRLIPVVPRDVDPKQVPEALERRNWIFLRNEDEAQRSAEQLIEAVETDQAWRDAHARLVVRSQEWLRHDRDRSFLLRGSDLDAAELWLADQGSHREAATSVQIEYIVASRRAAARRQRLTLSGVLVALGVAIALGIVALLQRNEAIANEKTASSRELAASALGVLTDDPELSLILAAEGARRAPTPEAERALRRALDASRVRATFQGSKVAVNSAAFSPGGSLVATGGQDRAVRVWDASTSRRIAALPRHRGAVHDVSFTPDGSSLLTSSFDRVANIGVLRLWRFRQGRVRGWTHKSFGQSAELSPQGRLLTTGFIAPAIMWRRAGGTWRSLEVLAGRGETGASATFSRDGKLAVGTIDRLTSDADVVRIWRTDSGEQIAELEGYEQIGRTAALSDDGKLVATIGVDLAVRVLDVQTRRTVSLLRGHQDFPEAVAFSPDGGRIVTGGGDGTARVWDVRRGRQLAVLRGHRGPVTSVAFDLSGRRVLTASEDGTARSWDVVGAGATRRPERQPRGFVVAISPDGNHAIVAPADDLAEIWDLGRDRRVATLRGHTRNISEARFAPDGKTVVTVSYDEVVARTWRSQTGAPLAVLAGPNGSLGTGSFSPDGKLVAAGRANGSAGVWNVETGETVRNLPPRRDDGYNVVALSPDGTLIATGGSAGRVRLWRFSDLRLLHTMRVTVLSDVYDLTFSPDSRLLASADSHGSLRVWDVTADVPRELPESERHTSLIYHVEFSADSTRLLTASADRTAKIVEARSGQTLAVLRGHTFQVSSARFSRDGRFVATTSSDRAVRIWEAETGLPVTTVQGTLDSVFDARFNKDATVLAVAGGFGPPATYRCDLCGTRDDLLDLADERITRSLTPFERVKYLHE